MSDDRLTQKSARNLPKWGHRRVVGSHETGHRPVIGRSSATEQGEPNQRGAGGERGGTGQRPLQRRTLERFARADAGDGFDHDQPRPLQQPQPAEEESDGTQDGPDPFHDGAQFGEGEQGSGANWQRGGVSRWVSRLPVRRIAYPRLGLTESRGGLAYANLCVLYKPVQSHVNYHLSPSY